MARLKWGMKLSGASVLRISITDRCNLRCIYCMPEAGVKLARHQELLSYEEISLIAHAALLAGITRIRITGGEPLVRKGIENLVMSLDRLCPEDLALTTNGLLLPQFAAKLKAAGLCRVTISLDTLRANRFARIARREGLKQVLDGIEAAIKNGLSPVKVNTVIIRGINDDELPDFVNFARELNIELRFIELMPTSGFRPECKELGEWRPGLVLPGAEIKNRIEEKFGPLQPLDSEGSVAQVYELANGARIGLITPVSEPFCKDCRRLRLSSEGRLRLCLFDQTGVDLKKALREQGADVRQLVEIFKQALKAKQTWERGDIEGANYDMFRVGG